MVVSNSIFLGVQLEYYANTKDYSSSADLFLSLHLVYAVLFTVEVCLHLIAEGIVHYLWSEDWALELARWFCGDFFVGGADH